MHAGWCHTQVLVDRTNGAFHHHHRAEKAELVS